MGVEHEKLKEILAEAASKATAEARAAYLSAACQGDMGLRGQVEALLAAHEQAQADDFLEQPVIRPEQQPIGEGPGTVIGRYRLLEEIGEGGFGLVFMAEQTEPVHRKVALKIVKAGMDTREVIARFEAERQALALMDHPNIARVLDAGATETGRPYFVMELVKGIPVTNYCDQQRLATTERLQLFIKVCGAVQHAHQKGIIHRDLKPTNILVTLVDGEPVPKVIDFGVAKALGQKLTEKTLFTAFQQMIGTPAYMSPEQAALSGVDVDTRSDIYSLGVLLYELLTGATPFDADALRKAALDEIRRLIRETEPPRPSTRLQRLGQELTKVAQERRTEPMALTRQLRGDLDWIAMKCLEKNRARRYETANELAGDIERHLTNLPTLARPPSTGYRIQKFVRRNKGMVGAAAVVAAALVLGLLGSIWQAVRATRAERAAEAAAQTARQNLYAANMNMAQLAWEQNNVGQVRRLLEETATFPERGFEWYYWQRQTHLELLTLRGHVGSVSRAAFSPDGQRIVTGGEDQTARVWDAGTGKQVLTLKGHIGAIYSAGSSPDSRQLAASICCAAYSPDGRRLVTGSHDQTARVWDAASGEQLLTLKGHTGGIYSAAFSPDSRRILTGSYDQTARVWDAVSGEELLTLKGHDSAINVAAFSRDGLRIVTGSSDASAKVWDAASGKELVTLTGHSSKIVLAAFSPDGQRIVTASADKTARIWDVATGKELRALEGTGTELWGDSAVALSPDSQRIATGCEDQTIRVWEVATGKELFTLKGHSAPITSVAFSPDGQRIVSSSADQTAKVWDGAGGMEALTLRGHTHRIYFAAISPDGQRIVTGSADNTAKVWEAESGRELFELRGHKAGVESVAFSPDGRSIATGSLDETAKMWEAATGKGLLPFKGHSSWIMSVAFSPDGQRIVTGSEDQTARVWEAATGKELLRLEGHTALVNCVAFSPDGRRIATASVDETARVWDAATGKELLRLEGHSGWVRAVAFSPDGQRIVTGSEDKTARVWKADSGKVMFKLRGHNDAVERAAFSPDGRRIITGGLDGTAKVWDTATDKELLTLKGHTSWVLAVAFFPDGRRILTGSDDRTARLWRAASDAQIAGWQQGEQIAADYLGAQMRERAVTAKRDRALCAHDPGAIKQWLVLLPIPFEHKNGIRTFRSEQDALHGDGEGIRALREEQVAQESQLRPRAGQQVKIGTADLVWRQVEQADYVLDFNRLAGAKTQTWWSVAYAVTYIHSEAAQSNVVLKVGSEDESRVYLNGKLIQENLSTSDFWVDQDPAAGQELKAGLNVLVFKVVNEDSIWRGSVRFTDAMGQPLKGIRVTLDPEDKL